MDLNIQSEAWANDKSVLARSQTCQNLLRAQAIYVYNGGGTKDPFGNE